MSKALELIYNNFESHNSKITELRDYYIEQIQNNIKEAKLNGSRNQRLPGNANISFKNVNAESLLFKLDEKGHPTQELNDQGGYFDFAPTDLGENCRRDIVLELESLGFEVEASHHECAPGQHEIDFTYANAKLKC